MAVGGFAQVLKDGSLQCQSSESMFGVNVSHYLHLTFKNRNMSNVLNVYVVFNHNNGSVQWTGKAASGPASNVKITRNLWDVIETICLPIQSCIDYASGSMIDTYKHPDLNFNYSKCGVSRLKEVNC